MDHEVVSNALVPEVSSVSPIFEAMSTDTVLETTEMAALAARFVNSTAAAAELAARVSESGGRLLQTTYRAIMLANSSMILRNAILLALLALTVFQASALALTLMFISSAALAWIRIKKPVAAEGQTVPALELESPFSLKSALKFGLFFLILQVAGTLAQRFLGIFGFYGVSIAGGLFSSASAVASAATLAAHHELTPQVAANGAILASITSALVTIPLVARVAKQRALTVGLIWTLLVVTLLGIVGAILQTHFHF